MFKTYIESPYSNGIKTVVYERVRHGFWVIKMSYFLFRDLNIFARSSTVKKKLKNL